jgi:hypothetical protein
MARAGSRNQHQRHGRILRQGFQAAQSLQRQERQAEIPPLCDLISAEECLAMKALTRPENGLSLESRSEKDLVQVRFRRCSSLSVSGSDHPVYVSNRLITFGSTATRDLERTRVALFWRRCSVGRHGLCSHGSLFGCSRVHSYPSLSFCGIVGFKPTSVACLLRNGTRRTTSQELPC